MTRCGADMARRRKWGVLCGACCLLAMPALADPPPAPGSPEAWLDRIERDFVNRSGLVLTLAGAGEGMIVFYAPLSQLWVIDPASPAPRVLAAAQLARVDDREHSALAVHWSTGEVVHMPATLPEIVMSAVSPIPHPLALFHDRLLAEPLAQRLAASRPGGTDRSANGFASDPGGISIPAGSRFRAPVGGSATGLVQLPRSTGTATLWESLGDHIAITYPDGSRTIYGWREVDAALTGEAR